MPFKVKLPTVYVVEPFVAPTPDDGRVQFKKRQSYLFQSPSPPYSLQLQSATVDVRPKPNRR